MPCALSLATTKLSGSCSTPSTPILSPNKAPMWPVPSMKPSAFLMNRITITAFSFSSPMGKTSREMLWMPPKKQPKRACPFTLSVWAALPEPPFPCGTSLDGRTSSAIRAARQSRPGWTKPRCGKSPISPMESTCPWDAVPKDSTPSTGKNCVSCPKTRSKAGWKKSLSRGLNGRSPWLYSVL